MIKIPFIIVSKRKLKNIFKSLIKRARDSEKLNTKYLKTIEEKEERIRRIWGLFTTNHTRPDTKIEITYNYDKSKLMPNKGREVKNIL
jgi:hypothetical protein